MHLPPPETNPTLISLLTLHARAKLLILLKKFLLSGTYIHFHTYIPT